MATLVTIFGQMKSSHGIFKKTRNLFNRLQYSTAAPAAVQDPLPRFRTLENNPTLHTHNHIGKYYRIDDSVKNKLFLTGGIPRLFDLQMQTFRENCVMVREQTLEVISYLKQIDFSQPAVRFILYGKNGTGKTSSLIHLIHYGYVSKFLLLHVPWVSLWTKTPKEIVPSQYKEEMIDLPVDSTIWLQHFKTQNDHLMKELDLRTTESYTWSVREVTEKGAPLMEVVEHGLQRGRHSSDCVAVLLKEIKLHSQSNKFKTMVVIDGVNAFFCHTNVKRADKTMVQPKEITVCNAFMKILNNDWNNAVIITTVDVIPKKRDFVHRDPVTPRALLGKEGFELLDPFIPVETKLYSEKEIESALDYFVDRLWIQSERAKSEEGRRQLKFLSGYNPYELMVLCDPL